MSLHPSSPTFSDTPVWDANDKRTDVLSAVDWLGNRFKVGDQVLYCIAAGRGQMMALGEVRAIRAWENMRKDWDRETREYIAGFEVEVQVVTQRTSGSWNNKQRTRPAWVNPMNITSMAGPAALHRNELAKALATLGELNIDSPTGTVPIDTRKRLVEMAARLKAALDENQETTHEPGDNP